MDEGKVAEACPKLEESLKLDDAIGTRFQLARCYEHLGRTASAWTLYLDVAAKARSLGQTDREAYARSEAARLKPALSKLTISVPPELRSFDLEVTRNELPVGRGQWDLALPVDPGNYQITVRAPGKKPWSASIEVNAGGASEKLALPMLEDAPLSETPASGAAATPKDTGAERGGLSTLHWVGIGAAGAGVVSLGIGGVFALSAKSKHDDSGCVDGACPNEAALDANEDARSAGNVATVAVVAGGVLVAAGVTLFLVAPPASDEGGGSALANGAGATQVTVAASPAFTGVVLGGAF
jgi:hypothetical protein